MNFLLDTNVVSESMNPRPNPGVTTWLANVSEDSVHLSVVTLTELRYGIERLAQGTRRRRLDDWLQRDLLLRFEGRIVPVDMVVADACGRLVARSETAGHPIEPRDAFIAATAEVYDMTLVTRNASHFQPTIKSILSPWT